MEQFFYPKFQGILCKIKIYKIMLANYDSLGMILLAVVCFEQIY